MEVCFVDVAQGSSSVILLGDGRAIVIDCGGRQSRSVLALLDRFQVHTIERLVVTHNHADHSAGAVAVLTAYQRRVEQIWMVYDTVVSSSVFWARVNEEIAEGRLTDNQLYRLEYRNRPTQVYRAPGILLTVISPNMRANIQAIQDTNPNATSGVLVLKLHEKQVVFSGDSTIPQWLSIRQLRGRAINCFLLTIPHHGGGVWERQRSGESQVVYEARVAHELDWFYTQAVRAEVGVISVGTSNSYRHPRSEVIDAFRRNGGEVFCTQMTARCDPDLEAQRRRALPIVLPSRSSVTLQQTESGRSSNVACGATLHVGILPGQAVIHRFAEHNAAVARVPVLAGQRPLCRRLSPVAPLAAAPQSSPAASGISQPPPSAPPDISS